GYAGVEAHDMSAVDLSGAQAPSVAAWNTYSELENGIVLINSSASVENSRFLNMPDGLGIFTNSASPYDLLFQRGLGKNGTTTFENCDIGIKGQKSVVFAQENNMENNRIGFNVEQSNRIIIRNNSLSGDQRQFMTGVSLSQNTPALVLVDNNDFSFSPQQFTSFIFPPEARGIIANENPFGVVLGAYRIENNFFSSISAELSKGITLQNGRFISIRNNSILSDGSNFSSSPGYGMKINTIRGFIGCNEIAELEVGTVNDTEFGIEINSDASSTFICNDMDQTDTGLKIMFSDANTDLIANTFNEHQVGLLVSDAIGDQIHNGNLWLEPALSGGWQAFHESSDQLVINASQFVADGAENSDLFPLQVNKPFWFSTVVEPGLTINCPSSGQCPDGIGAITEKMLEIDSTDQFVANGTISFDLYPSEQLWRAQRHLYARIKDFNIPLTYGTPEYSFVQTAETSNIGAFYLAEKKIEETLRPDAVLDSVIQDLNTERQETMSSLAQTNQLLLEASNSTDSLNAVQLKVNQLDTIRTIKVSIDSLGKIIEEKRVLSLASAHSLLNSISTLNSMESDWKFILNLFVSRLIEGKEMSKEESTLLLRIANMCIAKGGDATSLARSMYATINPDIQFDDVILCSPPPALAAPTPTGNALVYPNPTSGEEVNLKTGWTEANTAEAILFNALGQPVWQRTLELFGGNANFQLGNLPEGWYQLSLRAEGEQNVIPLMIQR
ncbi:MAG: T9SS type A sorting domain-containing protein, partial [Phaeodactylibacter sp.]|nr:T9SS type A sorting domain-containing protein [Phaeodactylibacter sp.]